MNGETVVTVQWGGACIAVLDRHVSTIFFIGQNPAQPVGKRYATIRVYQLFLRGETDPLNF
jgi:hypothetical protein